MPKKKQSLVRVRPDGEIVISIGSSDENADWLKRIGDEQKKDLAATDAALKQHKKDTNA